MVNENAIYYMTFKYWKNYRYSKVFECHIYFSNGIPPFCIRTRALAALVLAETIRLSNFLWRLSRVIWAEERIFFLLKASRRHLRIAL